jgi:hypothetical protein
MKKTQYSPPASAKAEALRARPLPQLLEDSGSTELTEVLPDVALVLVVYQLCQPAESGGQRLD